MLQTRPPNSLASPRETISLYSPRRRSHGRARAHAPILHIIMSNPDVDTLKQAILALYGADDKARVEANAWLATLMGRKLPSMVAQAPAFPGICAEG